ncbi:MAG: response regulator [Rhodocyclaceae bacterium]|jgi:signal transduction histidine kinase|nr:response regulator [Rhodocyclaceae bacterium]
MNTEDIQRRKVLLVEDSKVFQTLFSTLFRDTHFDVACAPSAAEALARLEVEKFDLICANFFLQDMEGVALCQQVRSQPTHAYTPFILLTSVESQDELQKTLPAGVTDIFHKSRVAELITFIKRYPFHDQRLAGRVLYVEDCRADRAWLAALLEDHGLRVDAFASADEAWEVFLDHPYDLVITDVVLEGRMSGLVFVNRIRRLPDPRGEIPVLALTAFDDPTRRIELFSIGVTDYVTKPVIEAELVARIHNLLAQQRANQEIRRQKALAEEASNAKSHLLSLVSHEFRTPINAILGYAQLLELDAQMEQLGETQWNQVNHIQRAAEHLLGLMNDILDLSRADAGSMKIDLYAVDLLPSVEAALSKVGHLARQHGIHCPAAPDETTLAAQGLVRADPLRLTQVLVNLLSNAIKYNRPGGSVTLAVGPGTPGHCRISVADTGIGIAPEDLPRLFQPFSRLVQHEEEIEGTGLGLALSQRLVELMGGQLGVQSEPEVGSTFWLELPLAAVQATTH